MTTTEKVFKTNDYDKFNLYKYNRAINEGLVKRIMESIDKIGYISGKSILVDKEMNIIDGQHRFEACKRKMLPIFYTIIKADPQVAIIELNAQQVSWKMGDYINSWANKGIKCYQELIEFEKTEKLGITNAIYVFFNPDFDKTMVKDIKAGNLYKVNPKAKEIAKFINECSTISYGKNTQFIRAISKTYDKLTQKQINKLKGALISLPQQPTCGHYVTAFENLINRGVSMKNRISLTVKVK